MAMSLEELLAKEGFKRGKSKTMARASFGGEGTVRPLSSHNEQSRPGSLGFRKTQRTKSDIPKYYLRGESPAADMAKGKKIKYERRGSKDRRQSKSFSIGSREDLVGNEFAVAAPSNEIVEVEERRTYNHIHSNAVYIPEESEANFATRSEKRGSYSQPLEKYKRTDKRYGSSTSSKNVIAKRSYNEASQKLAERPGTSSGRTNRSSQSGKTFDRSDTRKKAEIPPSVDTPALDEAAIQAMISILSGYAKQFIKDKNFRDSHRDSSFASLNVIKLEEFTDNEGKVLLNLEEAIEAVERAAEERASVKELKKASLQLSVITGLNSNESRDGCTCGIPNFKLSACAHFYLSVIYRLQKKDRISAKHLLQVFCDSPFQARTELLPDLWEQIILPHLSDLTVWYDKESDSMASSTRKLELVEKVYNEVLDSGTYLFAVYYKDWLTEGVEAPVLPTIQTPSIPAHLFEEADLDNQSRGPDSPVNSFLQVPMVSKTLYEAVFRHTVKPQPELVDHEEESFDISVRSSHDAAAEESSSEIIKCAAGDIESDASSFQNGQLTLLGLPRSYVNNSPERLDVNEKFGMPEIRQETSESIPVCYPNSQVILSKLANAVFGLEQPENPVTGASALLLCTQDVVNSDGLPEDSWSPAVESQENHQYFTGGTSFMSIPQDFVCPLTDMIFDDPVTLETGHTFESSAIKNWFGKGNRTCPLSRKTLEFRGVPHTNFILKRVINDWKLGHSKHLMDLASQVVKNVESKDKMAVFILEQLITASSLEERIRSVKQLTSLGGLVFLLRWFRRGNLEEKTRISALLLICIQADASHRNHIARDIDKLSLLDLLHSEQLKAKSNAIFLLTELICLSRRKDAKLFLDGIKKEEISSAMHVLLTFFQSCPREQRPLLAVLLLHLDLLVEPQNQSVYRDEAVDAITVALESSLFDEMVCQKCCRALLVLGGHFSFAGKIMTEDWILKQAGFLDDPVFVSPDNKDNQIVDNTSVMMEDVVEQRARDEWLVKLSASLLGDGSKSFLEAVAKCLFSGQPCVVRVCLTTVAWLSSALVSLSEAEYQLSSFSALISGLKECLENGELVEHKILASMSLLNFSKFPECRLLLMTMADGIVGSLERLAEVTWTAKELHSTICTH